MLTKLVTNNTNKEVEMIIITFLYSTYFVKEIESAGVKIYALNINKGILGPFNILKVFKIIYLEDPKIIQTWMYHADFLGVLLKPFFPNKKLIWNIRHSNLVKGADKITTIVLANILSRLSFVPASIICGSNAAYLSHQKIGYRSEKMTIIPNGFDTNLFAPNYDIKKSVLGEIGVPSDDLVIGHIGRENKVKNQASLIEAFAKLSDKRKNISLVLIGKGLKNKYQWHPNVNNNKKIIILDEVPNVERYLKAFDLFVLSSFSEGFPNVLGEAMASGVPCISTNAGDSEYIIGNSDLITEDASVISLYKKMDYWINLSDSEKEYLRRNSRNRVIDLFSIDKITSRYINLYKSI